MIETTITKIQYDADGVQRRWSIPFPYVDAKHISIYTKVGEEPTIKVVDNYEIDEDDEVVIYPTEASEMEPLAAGTKITIARETPETQLEDSSQIHFTSQDVERGLDKLTMITQELSTTSGETMEVSAAAFEAAEEAVNTANEANATANEAKTLAEQAVSTANDANTTANAANTKADNAVKTANDSNEKSTAAVSTANAAKTIAGEANSTANEANTTATEAKAIAQEANTTANNADKTATDADKKADNAVTVANTAKDIAEGIDAKATEALTNSTDAVNAANSAKQTAEGIDDKATQALTNSTDALAKATEAKNTADSYQGQITTLRNDVDDLGDQVAAIESKIPAEATAANQLADKAFVTEKTDELAADIAALDADKQDKLTAGDNITISADNVISATGGGAAPANMVTTDTMQAITAEKQFTVSPKVKGLKSITNKDLIYVDSSGYEKIRFGSCSSGSPQTYIQSNDNPKIVRYNNGVKEYENIDSGNIASYLTSTDAGIKGDYCTTYGILEAPNGILTNPSGMEVTLKQGVVLQLAGQDIKTTVSGDMTQTLTSTADCDLFYVSGTTSLMEVAQIVWSKNEPDNGQTGVLAWWNPDNKKWKFKSNDTGNVWAEAVATPVAHIHTDGTTITRIDHIGYRVMDDENFALKSDIPDNIYTQDNLLAGQNISIDEVLPEGGIDEHTVSVAHLDTLLPTTLQYDADVLGNLAIYSDAGSSTALVDSLNSSFDKAWKNNQSTDAGIQMYNNNSPAEPTKLTGNTFTADFWVNQPSRVSGLIDLFKWFATPYSGLIKIEESSAASNNKYKIELWDAHSGVVQTSTDAVFEVGASIWNHIEISVENNGTSANVLVFINGTKAIDATVSHTYTLSWNFVATNGLRNQSVDEIRISNIVRHTENFVPPTEPYSTATPTGNKVINWAPGDGIDYVVESKLPTAEDPTWYRKYKSGWVEQGGVATAAGTITFLKPFANTNYSVQATCLYTNYTNWGFGINKLSGASFYLNMNIGSQGAMWEAKGQGAE